MIEVGPRPETAVRVPSKAEAALVAGDGSVPERFNFARDVVEAIADGGHDRRALVCVDELGVVRTFTFEEIAMLAARWANLLAAAGLGRGDRALVYLDEAPWWHAVQLGILRLGAVVVPCPAALGAGDVELRARRTGARLLVAAREAEATVEPLRTRLPNGIQVVYLEDALVDLREHPVTAPCADTSAGETAFIVYTPGTAGDPRGVVWTHGRTFAERAQAAHWLRAERDDLVWCTGGFGWAASLSNALLGPWACGAAVLVHEAPFEAHQCLWLIERLGVTVLGLTPTEYRLFAGHQWPAEHDLACVRQATVTGGTLDPAVAELLSEAFGFSVRDGYGQAETSFVTNHDPRSRPGGIGRPIPGYDVDVVGESGQRAPANVEGDLAVRVRQEPLFGGYWEDAEATATAFRRAWYLTGDRALRRSDGRLWFRGRAADALTTGSRRVNVLDVERSLCAHQAVAECAVIGKPAPTGAQIVKAFVVLREGFRPTLRQAQQLRGHCRRTAPRGCAPRHVEFVEELPRTQHGELRRAELRLLEEWRSTAPKLLADADRSWEAERMREQMIERVQQEANDELDRDADRGRRRIEAARLRARAEAPAMPEHTATAGGEGESPPGEAPTTARRQAAQTRRRTAAKAERRVAEIRKRFAEGSSAPRRDAAPPVPTKRDALEADVALPDEVLTTPTLTAGTAVGDQVEPTPPASSAAATDAAPGAPETPVQGREKHSPATNARRRGPKRSRGAADARTIEYVAFVPTLDGYHVVACHGAPPAPGDHISVPGFDASFLVNRVGASPLPSDTRPCAFLEEIGPAVDHRDDTTVSPAERSRKDRSAELDR